MAMNCSSAGDRLGRHRRGPGGEVFQFPVLGELLREGQLGGLRLDQVLELLDRLDRDLVGPAGRLEPHGRGAAPLLRLLDLQVWTTAARVVL